MYKVIFYSIIVIFISTGIFSSYYFYQQNKGLKQLLNIRELEVNKSKVELGEATVKVQELDSLNKVLSKQMQDLIEKNKVTLTLYAELQAKYEIEKKKLKTIVPIKMRAMTSGK